ncbi:DUF4861 domain-containing protein [Maribacter polysaccharolyticus]|uniref:DUF4861 domain-containing protein n=1 Tax=Maribacter polysaccharolyticus TaxID=3020831 RepID=UPI00237F7FFC|nr:DUF4861 domain-containing protein [Maribacter polysaccharolyticus]MDE3740940.1 DUF4861 domain-containing protein [Maribacter polysaccharolyticus]
MTVTRNKHFLYLTLACLVAAACTQKPEALPKFMVTNDLNMDRSFETVEIELKDITPEGETLDTSKTYTIIDVETKEEQVSQVSDTDGDGTPDVLLFQPEIKANSTKTYEVVPKEDQFHKDTIPSCYSRFVPERTDDYAWENNRVAFRTYGPVAQKMIEENVPGGTLSSGIDAWLKRVDYPIINRWYKKELETEGTYHEDTGEGLDNFHVGSSRGVGGIAVKVDTTYSFSKNFTKWKTLETGPIRTSFWLDYAPWTAGDQTISERKYISLDYGSNLSKFVVEVTGTDTVSVGLTSHEKDGEISTQVDQGWVSYWEPHGDSEIGTGIVAPKGAMIGYENYLTNKTDESNLYAHFGLEAGKVTYYAGFGWKKSGQFNTQEDWNGYLKDFATKINNPLKVSKL